MRSKTPGEGTTTVRCGPCSWGTRKNKPSTFTGTQEDIIFDMYHIVNCQSTWVIYVIECNIYSLQHVGKSETGFNIQLNNHRNHIKKAFCSCEILLNPDDDRIVSHDAPRFMLYYHCVRDTSWSVIFSTREVNIDRSAINSLIYLCEYSGPFWAMFSKIRLDVDEKCCLFQEGGHLGPNLPPPDPVSPHFSPPDSIQRHHLAGFMKTVPSDSWSPHTLNWLKYRQETQLLPMVLLRWLSSWFLNSKRNIQVHQKDTLDLSIHSSCFKALNDGGCLRLNQVRRLTEGTTLLPHPPR